MKTAAQTRAEDSRSCLTKRYGRLLQEWATARRTASSINRTWDVARLAVWLKAHQTNEPWLSLEGVSDQVRELDRWLCVTSGCLRLSAQASGRESASPALSVDQVVVRMRETFPDISREKVLHMLSLAVENGSIRRVKRGSYQQAPWDWDYWEIDDSTADNDDDKWEERAERAHAVQVMVLFSHYLLPHQRAYQKARELGFSERSYYYHLATALRAADFVADERG